MNRRDVLCGITSLSIGSIALGETNGTPPTKTPGIVLTPFDLSLSDWPARAQRAGIKTIALHAARRLDVLHDFILSDAGQAFLEDCSRRNIHVEYELHAMSDLLSREYFYKDPTLFRMDGSGRRNPDFNCNPLSERALEIIAEKAVAWARIFRPTTERYFYWPDDGAAWCESHQARGFSASEQSLLVENAIVKALRKHIPPEAKLSHLAYHNTLEPPRQIQPEAGIFLEFAPIMRRYDQSISNESHSTKSTQHQNPATNAGYIELMRRNLETFGKSESQVLEYWLDASMFSSWNRPSVRLPWRADVCGRDVEFYRSVGFETITTFAAFLDAEYVQMFGDIQPVLTEYGECFRG
jgi:hypothetical protein